MILTLLYFHQNHIAFDSWTTVVLNNQTIKYIIMVVEGYIELIAF